MTNQYTPKGRRKKGEPRPKSIPNEECYQLFRLIYSLILIPKEWGSYVLDEIERRFRNLIGKQEHLKPLLEKGKLPKYLSYLHDNYVGYSGVHMQPRYDRWNLWGKENFRHLQQMLETLHKALHKRLGVHNNVGVLMKSIKIRSGKVLSSYFSTAYNQSTLKSKRRPLSEWKDSALMMNREEMEAKLKAPDLSNEDLRRSFMKDLWPYVEKISKIIGMKGKVVNDGKVEETLPLLPEYPNGSSKRGVKSCAYFA